MKSRYLIFYAVFVFCLQACDVTDRVPEDAITDLNYWRKTEDLKMYARNFYTTLSAPSYHDATTDICVDITKSNTLFNTRSVPTGDDGWSYDDWANIRGCNYFMTHYQTVQGDPADINHYVGEIRFFRANEYFNKVKKFGDVPWYDQDMQTNDTELLYKGRDPRSFIIGKIIEDLEFAAAYLKLPSQVDNGQLHRYAAYQLLARVCLFEASWRKYRAIDGWEDLMQKAASAAKAVMDSELYDIVTGTALYTMGTGYPLNYKAQFIQEDMTKDRECILPRIYIRDVLMHGLSRISSIGLSKDFIESFLDIEGKPIALSTVYLGDDSIAMEVVNRDPRLRNIIDTKFIPTIITDAQPVANQVVVPTNDCATGYSSVKFKDPDPAQQEANQTTTDWYVFRYAETLLIYAEAKAELGEITQTDLDHTINKLRARLDQPGQAMGRLDLNPPADPLAVVNGQPRYGYDISPLLYEIRRERCIELAFENFRWDDICRWKAGKLIENPKTMYGMVVNDLVIDRYTRFNGGLNPFANKSTVTITDWDKTKQLLLVYPDNPTRKWDDRLYLDPLPQNQTTLNPNLLPQNPGWN